MNAQTDTTAQAVPLHRPCSPLRVQRRRSKGWKMPENTVSVCRPGKWGNPFRIGGYFKVGGDATPLGRFIWMERCIWKSADIEDALATGFVLVKDQAQAVEMFERLMKHHPWKVDDLRGKNLACWCKPGTPCHADTLLRLANKDSATI